MSKGKITFIANSQSSLQRWIDRIGVPNHIPDEQAAKYRALIRQRRCDEGKRKKKEKRARKKQSGMVRK